MALLRLSLLLLLATVDCSGCNTAVYHLAVGWTGALPSWNGPCDTSTLRPAGILSELAPGTFAAQHPGDVEVRCQDGVLRLLVRTPTHLSIDAVAPVVAGDILILGAVVADADGSLAIGEDSLQWSVTAPLHVHDRCRDGLCVSAGSLRVVADRPGEAVVTVRLGTLEASRTVIVGSR